MSAPDLPDAVITAATCHDGSCGRRDLHSVPRECKRTAPESLPDAAITAARRAFPIAAPHALKAALEAAAPALRAQGAAAERAKWREALAEHVHWVTSYEGDRICAACLSIWPCAGATLLDGDDG